MHTGTSEVEGRCVLGLNMLFFGNFSKLGWNSIVLSLVKILFRKPELNKIYLILYNKTKTSHNSVLTVVKL